MNNFTKILNLVIIFTALVLFSSCAKEHSSKTGWNYNDPKNGGFEVTYIDEQETGPGLVFIEGGAFTMGNVEEDVMRDWSNIPRTVTVSSFYMDETEVSNVNYREYLFWLDLVFTQADLKVVYDNAYPDHASWRKKLGAREVMVEYYFEYPTYNDYPVVGVSWLQAVNYAA